MLVIYAQEYIPICFHKILIMLKMSPISCQTSCTKIVCIALTQSLDPEQSGLCVHYIEVASIVTVDWHGVGVKLN